MNQDFIVNNIKTEFIMNYSEGLFDDSKETIINEKFKVIYHSIYCYIAEMYQGRFRLLFEKGLEEKNPRKIGLLNQAIRISRTGILEKVENRGFFYKIDSPIGCSSFLIGTIHLANTAMEEGVEQKFNFLLNQSCKLITEVGDDPAVMGSGIKSIDSIITELFRKNQKEILSLETVQQQLEGYNCMMQKAREATQVSEKSLYAYNHREFAALEMIEAWQNGDEKEMEFLTSNPLFMEFINTRNRNWIEKKGNNLINMLNSSPACIAVGASHLFGEEGLIQLLSSKGLKVTRLNFEGLKEVFNDSILNSVLKIERNFLF